MDVDAAVAAVLLGDAAAGRSDHAGGVALVHHHQGVILLSEVADLVHRGDVAVHGEHTVGHDDAVTLHLGLLETVLQSVHIGVGIAVTHGLAQADSVDDRSVVQRVGDDGVLGVEQGLEHSPVGIEARSVKDGVLRMEIFGDGLLESLVHVLRTADEAHGRHAVAADVHHLLGGLDEAGIVGQAEVVVGAEIERFGTVLEGYLRGLGGSDVAFLLVEARSLDGGEFVGEEFLEVSVHIRDF